MLVRDVAHKQTSAWPRRWVLLSALKKEGWSQSQTLCFSNAKGRTGDYIIAHGVFPADRREAHMREPEVLPADAEALVKFAVARSRECPVLFWGGSSQYAKCSAWPKDQQIVSVAAAL